MFGGIGTYIVKGFPKSSGTKLPFQYLLTLEVFVTIGLLFDVCYFTFK